MIGTIALVILGLVLAVFGTIGLLDATRGTPVNAVTSRREPQPPSIDEPVFRHMLETYTGVALGRGHVAELTSCGDETYPRLWADLRAARDSIVIQMYYCKPGRVADELREVLVDRARAGVEVLLLLDAFGSSFKRDYLDALRAAGVEVAKFRALKPLALQTAFHRAHIRAIVVDGTIGWTGGFGFDDKWLGDGRHEGQWRDTGVRFTGPAVAQLLATFATCWAEATGELLAGARHWGPATRAVASAPDDADAPVAGFLHASPGVGSTEAERLVALAVVGSRKRLWITTPYFVADDDFRRFACAAARRGVDVRILTAGEQSDVKSTRYAARARYEELLEDGVRIWEYRPSMIHAKAIVVDGVWGTAGTMNLDNRSMAFNDECMYMAYDPAFVATLERMFEADLALADEIDLATFRRRPWATKLAEHFWHLLSRLL
jgi:cardiolipin synthase A/B